MDLRNRISACVALGNKIKSLDKTTLGSIADTAFAKNPWFAPDFTKKAIYGTTQYLEEDQLTSWAKNYKIKDQQKTVGL